MRAADIDAIAVSTKPGIVLSLKVGMERALSIARDIHCPLIPIHHMRAHALVARLFDPSLVFPFTALLISGGHCIICLVKNPYHFQIMAEARSGSPGECLDKLAREIGLVPLNGHYAAALEKMAKTSSDDNINSKYKFSVPERFLTGKEEKIFNFHLIKEYYLPRIHSKKFLDNNSDERANLCYYIQKSVAEYTCRHLESALYYLVSNNAEFVSNVDQRKLVVAGGVASNQYFLDVISKVAFSHKFSVIVPPAHLCTDNGVMVAWAGAEIFMANINNKMPTGISENPCANIVNGNKEILIYWPDALPHTIYVSRKAEIGPKMEWCKRNANINADQT